MNVGASNIPPGWLTISGNGAWYGSRVDLTKSENELAPGEVLDVEVIQDPRWGASIRYVDPVLVVQHSSVRDPNNADRAAVFPHDMTLHSFAAGIKCEHALVANESRLPQIAVVGYMGSGKTTFVNTIATVFSNAHGFTKPLACGSGDARTHTRETKAVVLPTFMVTDTYGLEKGRWPAAHLQLLLDGVLPSNTPMERVPSLTAKEIGKLRQTAWKRRVDAVIFVVSVTMVTMPSEAEKASVIEAFEAIRHANPVVAVTKCDAFVENTTADNFDLNTDAMEELRRLTAAFFHIEARRVCPVMSYRDETHRSTGLDQAVMALMETTLRFADDVAAQKEALSEAMPHVGGAWTKPGWTYHDLLLASK